MMLLIWQQHQYHNNRIRGYIVNLSALIQYKQGQVEHGSACGS